MGDGEKRDIYNTAAQLHRELEAISNWKTTQHNKERMLQFLRRSEVEGLSDVRQLKYVYAFKWLLKVCNKDFDELTNRDIEDYLLSMNGHYKASTKQTRWYPIKKFLCSLDKADLVRDFKPAFDKSTKKMPDELLTEAEVLKMVEAAYSTRDKALVYVLYEGGLRISELLGMRMLDVEFDEKGGVIRVNGKTGERRVRIVHSAECLKAWVKHHPLGKRESYVWISQNDFKTPIRHRVVDKMLKELAVRCNIDKRIHPHLLRHSRATHLAGKLTESQLKIFFGWSGGSAMPNIYVHLSGRDVDDAIMEASGMGPKEVEEQSLKASLEDPGFKEFVKEMYVMWKAKGPIKK